MELGIGKEQVEAVIQRLRRRDRASWAIVSTPCYLLSSRTISYTSTHKPHRTPTASIKAQACCRCLSSRDTLSLPRCLAERRSISAGRRYGLYRFRWDVDASVAELAIFVSQRD